MEPLRSYSSYAKYSIIEVPDMHGTVAIAKMLVTKAISLTQLHVPEVFGANTSYSYCEHCGKTTRAFVHPKGKSKYNTQVMNGF